MRCRCQWSKATFAFQFYLFLQRTEMLIGRNNYRDSRLLVAKLEIAISVLNSPDLRTNKDTAYGVNTQ